LTGRELVRKSGRDSVREWRSKPTQRLVVVQAYPKNQHDDIVQSFRPKLVVPKRPTGAP